MVPLFADFKPDVKRKLHDEMEMESSSRTSEDPRASKDRRMDLQKHATARSANWAQLKEQPTNVPSAPFKEHRALPLGLLAQ